MFALSNEENFNLQHTIAYLLLFISCIALVSVQCIAMLAIPVTMDSAVKGNFTHPSVGTPVLVYCVCCLSILRCVLWEATNLHASIGLVHSFHTSSLSM